MEDNQIPKKEETPDFLTSFARATQKMIATNELAYQGTWNQARLQTSSLREYTQEEVSRIISGGSLVEQQNLSRNYFSKNGYYKQINIYYATLLKYVGLLIPNPSIGKTLSTSYIQKRYYAALDYVDRMQLPTLVANIALKALVNGCYYGIRIDGEPFQLIDLPSGYACSRFKDIEGNDILEFDLSYFRTITDKELRNSALAAYPAFVAKAWKDYERGNRKSKWLIIPKEYGVCFPFFEGNPLFLSIIPSIIEYEDALASHRDREAEEIHKIIVQKIPHLSDGRLLFEPDEAEEIHAGTVGMMKGDKNVSVLTTYGDVDAIVSNSAADRTEKILTRIEQNIYSQAGVTGQVFASTGAASLESSLNNDLALMMYFANKVSHYISNALNAKFGNANISFKYSILPITYYNYKSYAAETFKLVGSGYSIMLPALAYDLNQRDFVNVKDLENEILRLGERLKPLSNSYTQSGADGEEKGSEKQDTKGQPSQSNDEGGRPKKEESEKSEKTHQNEESLDRTGGS